MCNLLPACATSILALLRLIANAPSPQALLPSNHAPDLLTAHPAFLRNRPLCRHLRCVALHLRAVQVGRAGVDPGGGRPGPRAGEPPRDAAPWAALLWLSAWQAAPAGTMIVQECLKAERCSQPGHQLTICCHVSCVPERLKLLLACPPSAGPGHVRLQDHAGAGRQDGEGAGLLG